MKTSKIALVALIIVGLFLVSGCIESQQSIPQNTKHSFTIVILSEVEGKLGNSHIGYFEKYWEKYYIIPADKVIEFANTNAQTIDFIVISDIHSNKKLLCNNNIQSQHDCYEKGYITSYTGYDIDGLLYIPANATSAQIGVGTNPPLPYPFFENTQ